MSAEAYESWIKCKNPDFLTLAQVTKPNNSTTWLLLPKLNATTEEAFSVRLVTWGNGRHLSALAEARLGETVG